MTLLFILCTLFPGFVSATTYYESYVGSQAVYEGQSYNFGFDFWYDNDVFGVGTDSSLDLVSDAYGMTSEEEWLSSMLYIDFSSSDCDLEKASITLTAWDASGHSDEMKTVTYDFDAGYETLSFGFFCIKTVYHEETESYSYELTGSLLDAFEDFGWGNINIKADCTFKFANDFNINKVAMEVVTGQGQTTPDPVPEPATMFLMGTGLFGLAGLRRKKR